MRIVSLLPSATDTVLALDAGNDLLGVSHSCYGDFKHLPRLTSTWINTGGSAAEINQQVCEATQPLYRLDIEMLERLAPDVVISQSLCDVCAVPTGDVESALATLTSKPELIDLTPKSLVDLPDCFARVGAAIGRRREAARLVDHWHASLESFRDRYVDQRLRIVMLDWLDPPFVSGHWVPEMIEWMGMTNLISRPAEPSFAVAWEDIERANPDLLLAACCGFSAERAQKESVQSSKPIIYVDGSEFFCRPSPALLKGMELLSASIEEHLYSAS